MKKRGINFIRYVQHYNIKTKKMPRYAIKSGQALNFIYDDAELAKVTKNDEEAQYMEIYEAEDVEMIQKNFEKFGLGLEQYYRQETEEETGKTKKKKKEAEALKPLFSIESEKDENEFFSLKEVLSFIRAQAYKGMQIQRYKGLGEMNPSQLWETTMDPARRTILKVSLEDAVEVDKTFTILMGDEVGPRREFIEAHAHDVKELDI